MSAQRFEIPKLQPELTLVRGSTSLRSSILAGVFDNGRRYQVIRDIEIGIPSDEKQFGSMEYVYPVAVETLRLTHTFTGQATWRIQSSSLNRKIPSSAASSRPMPNKFSTWEQVKADGKTSTD